MTIIILQEGSEIADGRYRLQRRLGSGGMATVWLALDTRLARDVAIKLPTDALAADETFSVRFEREAQTAAALSHPHLVSVYDYGTEGERPYLVSEFIDGSNLAELRERKRPPETELLAKTLLEALAHIHAAGIVHRDVKPGNVLVDRAGRILITDFGIAQSTEETSLTQTGHVIGTLSYLAPEVKRGHRAGPESDLYSLGVVLSEQLTHDDPDRVARLVDALTQENPEDRPRSAERALDMLARRSVVVQPTEQIPIAPTAATEPVTRRDRTSPRAFPVPPATSAERRPGFHISPLAAGLTALLVAIVVGVAIAAGGGDDGSKGSDPTKKAQASDTSTQRSTSTTDSTAETTAPATAETTTTPTTDAVPTGGTDSARGIALNNEGFALLQQGDIEGALPKLAESVASFPSDSTEIDYAYALFNYAQALRLSGDPAAAIPLLEKRLSFSDFKVDEVEAELKTAQKAAGVK